MFNPLKTEVMLISNSFYDYNTELIMDNTVLKIVEIHKHLGVFISSNNKWSKHIDSLTESTSKQISFLRKIKYQFSKKKKKKKKKLLILYIIVPTFDHCLNTLVKFGMAAVKKVNRKVQEEPQANRRHQEEKKK